MVCRRSLLPLGARLLAALRLVAPLYAGPVLGATAMPLLAVGYSKNGVARLPSVSMPTLLSWWPWATLPPMPCTMGIFVPLCPLCTHQCVLLPTMQRSQFLATLRTTAVPSPASFAERICGPLRCRPLSALGGGAVSAPCGPAPSLQGPTPKRPSLYFQHAACLFIP